MNSQRIVKVAVVGTGLSGLVTAYLLSNASDKRKDVEFEIHLFEKNAAIGLDAHSISMVSEVKGANEWRINVPMRSFQGGYYPQLIAMYRHLGVRFSQADFSYSFSSLIPSSKKIIPNMIYNGSSGRQGIGIPSALHSPGYRNNSFVQLITWLLTMTMFAFSAAGLLINYLRTILWSIPLLHSSNTKNITFREWCNVTCPNGRISRMVGLDVSWRNFCFQVLVPLFSAVCTAPEESILDHPVEEFLDYIWLTLFTPHYVVNGGVRYVMERLTSNIQHVHLGSAISSIKADPTNPRLVSIECTTSTEAYHGFSHIVLATQANSAVPLLKSYLNSISTPKPATDLEQLLTCLRSFQYTPNIVVNHADDSLLPSHPRDRRDLNLISVPHGYRERCHYYDDGPCVMSSYTMATQILPQPTACFYPKTIYQTTNPVIPPKSDSIISVAYMERAVLTLDGKKALRGLWRAGKKKWWQSAIQGESELGPLQGAMVGEDGPRIWMCGAYAYCGIPLLEGCVVSGRNVVEKGILAHEGVDPLNFW